MASTKSVLVGKFGAPHGVRGEIRLKSFTEDPLAIAGYKTLRRADRTPVRLVSVRPQGAMLVVRVEGVGDRDAAETLNGIELFVDRAELAEPEDDEFYHADLVGLEARDISGAMVGRVAAVHDFGAGDIIEIKPATGSPLMLAFTRQTVPEIDIAAGYLVVDLPADIEARDEAAEK